MEHWGQAMRRPSVLRGWAPTVPKGFLEKKTAQTHLIKPVIALQESPGQRGEEGTQAEGPA